MKKLILLLAILVYTTTVHSQHFKKGYVSVNPYSPMNIVVESAEIDGVPLEAGDEIAVFDGNLCCGVLELTGPIAIPLPSINASAESSVGALNGFNSGNTMYFRFWDSSAGIEHTNIIPVVEDAGNSPIPNVFSANGTAFVQLSTGNTTKTFNGAFFGVWNWPSNWTPSGVPEPNNDVVLPVLGPTNQPIIYPTDEMYCGSLSFSGASTLTIQSDGSGTGSLVVANGVSGSTTVTAQRYLPSTLWHMLSSPVTGQTFATFLAANASISNNGTNDGLIQYVESSDTWDYNISANSLTPGVGFGARIDASGVVTFSGSLSIGNSSTGVATSGNGWNLVGNPFPSAMLVTQEAIGFLKENESVFAPSFEAIYMWDGGADEYTAVNMGSGNVNVASGQGFFVKAASGGSVNFNQSMQVHDTGEALKSADIGPSGLTLKVKSGEIYSSTEVNFNEDMTLGLDRFYDAGILKSGKGFDLYTRLVEDNGVDFDIQWLPGKANDSYEIPIGLDATNGGEVVFSAQSFDLPFGYEVVLEDRLAGNFSDISNGEIYVADVESGNNGTGRFYLHVGAALQTSVDEDLNNTGISVYTIDRNLYIKGKVSRDAQIMVYAIDGRLMNQFDVSSESLNRVSISNFTPGVYFVKVMDANKYKPVKFVVEQ